MVTTCMILCIVPGSAACVCDLRFSTGRCFDGEGNCECLENYRGSQCNQCNEGYYGFPNCKRKLTGDPCFEENYNYIYSVLTRILPWGVPGPPLLRNRGPVRTLGGLSPHSKLSVT